MYEILQNVKKPKATTLKSKFMFKGLSYRKKNPKHMINHPVYRQEQKDNGTPWTLSFQTHCVRPGPAMGRNFSLCHLSLFCTSFHSALCSQ